MISHHAARFAVVRWAALIALALLGLASAALAEEARQAFGAHDRPSSAAPNPIGEYARGCLAGGVALRETGPSWQAMRLSRNRNWGHPDTIAFIERLAEDAPGLGWPRLYVGDISQPRGGPMLSGHRSHQIGLDADIWFRPGRPQAISRRAREEIGSPSVVRRDRLDVNGNWTPAHHALIRRAAEDTAVARIFVNAAIKKALCRAEPAGDRAWLRKVRAWWGHDSHFHVRLTCPAGAEGCVDQAPPPSGDGCGETLDWWFTDEALNPKPSGKPRKRLALADLPRACLPVIDR
ncbi:MAG: penicillin-insensitive murein endopeptidase [Pseudomonadota bacterium]